MEGGSWRPAGQGDTGGDPPAGDWRSQLQPESRHRIVNKIMETLQRHLPIPASEGLTELKKIAVRFEEKIHTAATSQTDYLRKISLKMLSMETKTQNPQAINPSSMNPAVGNQSVDAASVGIQSQVGNQGQSLPIVNQSSLQQPHLAQNLTNNTPSASMQVSSGLRLLCHPCPECLNPLYPTVMQGRQQPQSTMSQHQQQSQNSLIYQQQLQQQLLKQKIQHPSLLQPHTQQQLQQQQSLLQQNPLQSSQQPLMQLSSSMPASQTNIQQSQPTMMQTAPQSGLQQNQQNSVQQSIPSLLQQNSTSVVRQQLGQPTIHQQSTPLQQQQSSVTQQSMLASQQQQQLLGQQTNMSSMQQNQLLSQQNSVSDLQQQQQQRLSGQQNNILNMQQSQHILNQQYMSLHQQQQQQQLGSHNNLSVLQQQQLGQQNNLSGLQQQQQQLSQNNLSGLQQQQQTQQQQLLGNQPGISNMQPHQRPGQILQQNKTAAQQQTQQSSLAMLHSQNQQSQHQSSQQQLMPQIQTQPGQLQQLGMQQQANPLQREMQQRYQASGALIQSQNAIDQQKQFIQSQRLPEVSSSTSLDSTAQTGNGVVDWQEEIYQKIKAMKELYFAELNELYQKLALKFQQCENQNLLPHAKQSEQIEKMKNFKVMLERSISFLQISKSSIQPGLKEKLPLYEKQISTFLTSNRKPRNMPPQSQFQPPGGHAQSMPQQQSSQVSQLQPHDGHVNQVQQMNLQGSVTSMQQASASSMPNGSMPLSTLGVPTAQQNISNTLQSSPNVDPIQGSSFGSLQPASISSVQQSAVGALQNAINAPQHTGMNSLPQSSVNSLQTNSNILQQQQIKLQEQQQQQLMQSQQMKQLQQRHIQQQMFQQQQKQQMLQQQQQPAVQQQLLQQQKQQQNAQLPMHQMSQLNQMNEDMKIRQGAGIKPGLYQQHFQANQRHTYFHPQLKTGTSFPISSPQNIQASSPQISQHSSPQVDQHGLLSSLPKTGTPLQSASSPFVVPSPSPSTPIARSPITTDSEKPLSGITSIPGTVNMGHQQTTLTPSQPQSIAVGTPGISASPLLAEFTNSEANQPNTSVFSGKSSATERPLERLIKVIQSLSPKELSSSISDIGSVVSMTDRIAGSAPGNGSRAAVGEDLVAMTKCRLQARNFMSQDGSAITKKMKRHTSAMPLNAVSSIGSIDDSFKQLYNIDTSELESTATSSMKKQKVEVNHALLEEIRETNQQLIDTVVAITDEDVDSVSAAAGGYGGTVVKCSFRGVALNSSLKSLFASAQVSPILPLRLLVPSSYPKCSPTLLDTLPVELSENSEDLSAKVKSRFSASLRCLLQPMSVKEMAKTWDVCARKVIAEYAQLTGGGSFSSRYGAWESCVSA
ncbi:hypothetical protein J5N97_023240 [Dioscorea zingiberensis]|uniref:Mediator complex subunit 15 KIX domain-containing protein n=1 Tax=Dioscorea zingiberensis TaxID=325984 RepID=A0A9D5CBY2_9LILI|nr:hypothetical protein J5N97_023240 [Dioscorea zingiberensis]